MHPSNKVTKENSKAVVTYHKPTNEKVERHANVATSAHLLIDAILMMCPDCADRSAAIRCVREAKMWASAAIALEGGE